MADGQADVTPVRIGDFLAAQPGAPFDRLTALSKAEGRMSAPPCPGSAGVPPAKEAAETAALPGAARPRPVRANPEVRKARFWRRDETIGLLSDHAWAVYVRRGGHMAAIAAACALRGGSVDESFAVPSKEMQNRARTPAGEDARHGADLLLADLIALSSACISPVLSV